MKVPEILFKKEVKKFTKFRDGGRHRWIEFRYKILGVPIFTNRVPWN